MTAERNNDLTLDDLCAAYRKALYWKDSHPDLTGYHARKLEILEDLFDFHLPPKPVHGGRDTMDHDAVVRAAHTSLKRSTRPSAGWPFATYIEGRPGPKELRLHRGHQRRFSRMARHLKAAHEALFKDALLQLDPTLKEKTINRALLYEKGLPTTEPDPDDYFEGLMDLFFRH